MYKLVIFSVLVAFVAADVSHLVRGNRPFVTSVPVQATRFVAILKSDSDISPDGSYRYAYETENGIAAQEQGNLRVLPEGAGTAAQGSYQYISPEGVPVSVQYVADENGFQPQSDILPTPPPVPSYILRALDYIARNPEPAKVNKPTPHLRVAPKNFGRF